MVCGYSHRALSPNALLVAENGSNMFWTIEDDLLVCLVI